MRQYFDSDTSTIVVFDLLHSESESSWDGFGAENRILVTRAIILRQGRGMVTKPLLGDQG